MPRPECNPRPAHRAAVPRTAPYRPDGETPMCTSMSQGPSRRDLDRRVFLSLLSTTAGTAALAGSFVSCGGGDHPGAPDGAAGDGGARDGGALEGGMPDDGGTGADGGGASGGKPVTGTIERAEIGGTGLRVHSLYGKRSDVQEGEFSTAISTDGAQLLFASDAAGRLRGLAVTRPSDGFVVLDAASTALATVFGSLGVMTVEPVQAATRLAAIPKLASWKPLVAFLAANLPGKDLGTVAGDPQFAMLRDQVVAEALALPPSMLALASSASSERGFVDGALAPASAATHGLAQVSLKNSAWRFVTVGRRELDASRGELRAVTPRLQQAQNPLPEQVPNLVSGANPVTWGNLFTLQAGSAGAAVDPVDLQAKTDVALLEYWIVGPGGTPNGKTLPGTVTLGPGLPTTATVLFYLFAPLLDFVAGRESILGFLKKGSNLDEIDRLAGAVYGAGLNTGGLLGALNSKSLDNVKGGLVDMANAMLGLSGGIFSAAGLTTAALTIELLGAVQGITSFFFSLYNVGKLAQQLLDAPPVGVVEISTKPIAHYTAKKLSDDLVAGLPASLNTLGHALYVGLSSPINGQFIAVLLKPESNTRVVFPQMPVVAVSRLNVLDHFAVTVAGTTDHVTFLWDGTQARDIGRLQSPTFTYAGAINDSDQLIGASNNGFETHMYRWKDQAGFQLQDTGYITARPSNGFALNNQGQAVFYRGTLIPGTGNYRWDIVLMVEGQPPVVIVEQAAFGPGTQGAPLALNDAGQVAYTGNDGLVHLWQDGHDAILPGLPETDPSYFEGGSYTLADINRHGWVLGWGGKPSDRFAVPLLLWAEGTLYKVSDLVEFDGVVVGIDPAIAALNDVGQILCRGVGPDVNASPFPVLLTPKSS
jgi:hypothetical protein